MKVTATLIRALERELEPHVCDEAELERIRLRFGRVLELYRLETDDFAPTEDGETLEFSGTRAADSEAIREILRSRGLSQRWLARQLEIADSSVSQALKRRNWRFARFEAFATALGVPISAILQGAPLDRSEARSDLPRNASRV